MEGAVLSRELSNDQVVLATQRNLTEMAILASPKCIRSTARLILER